MSNNKHSKIDKGISSFFGKSSMGYSEEPLYDYEEPDYDLMNYEGKSGYAKDFNLKKGDILEIIKSITQAAAYNRSSQKSMMATRSSTIIPPDSAEELKNIFKDSEALIQTRQTHMDEVASISEQIANGLGLNSEFARSIGMLHDIGHTWNGHSGEKILSAIARLNDCGYIVHNAMGAYVIERERIIEDAIKRVQRLNKKAKEKDIREFMRYVIDGVVSHNGEGSDGTIVPKDKTADEMQEEIRKCFTEKGFDRKIMPATMEGSIIRYADIIAYTRSDILDGFRLKDVNGNKIINEFDDEYLAIIGTVLARQNDFKKMLTLENKFLLEMYGLSKRIEDLSSPKNKNITPEDKVELERTRKEREIIEKKYKEFEKYKMEYAKDYINKIEPKSAVKIEITQMMNDIFMKDLIETSRNKGYVTMSPLMRKTLFSLRELNVRKIVPYTRRKFEAEELPIAANSLIEMLTNTILETGIAYDTIPENEQNHITPMYSHEEHEKEEAIINREPKMWFEKKVCHYYRNQEPKKLDFMHTNVLNAMRDIAEQDIKIALGEEEYDGELKELYEASKINPIKIKIAKMGKTSETMTAIDKENLLKELMKDKEKNIERAVASKMAIEYVGGMTDNSILAVLIEKNLISRKQLIEGYGRAEPGKQEIDPGVKKLQKVFAKNESMIDDDINVYKKHKIPSGDGEEICL